MAKVKYYYDAENLAYRIIKPVRGKKIGVVLLFLFSAALFGFLCFVVLLNTPYFETPKDKLQAREIENMKIRYEILNRKMDQIDEVLEEVEGRDNNLYRAYFNASAIPDEQRKAGFGGVNRYKDLEGFDNS
ncbi:MAG: peptidase M23, partial [Flavobacterium psychrophilum]